MAADADVLDDRRDVLLETDVVEIDRDLHHPFDLSGVVRPRLHRFRLRLFGRFHLRGLFGRDDRRALRQFVELLRPLQNRGIVVEKFRLDRELLDLLAKFADRLFGRRLFDARQPFFERVDLAGDLRLVLLEFRREVLSGGGNERPNEAATIKARCSMEILECRQDGILQKKSTMLWPVSRPSQPR